MEALLARTKRKLVSNLPATTVAAADGTAAATASDSAAAAGTGTGAATATTTAAAAASEDGAAPPPAAKSKYLRRGEAQKVLQSAGVVEPTVQLPLPSNSASASTHAQSNGFHTSSFLSSSADGSSSAAAALALTRPLATAATVAAADGSVLSLASLDLRGIQRELRLLGEPVRYFGEDAAGCFARLQAAQQRRAERDSGTGAQNEAAAAAGLRSQQQAQQLQQQQAARDVEAELAELAALESDNNNAADAAADVDADADDDADDKDHKETSAGPGSGSGSAGASAGGLSRYAEDRPPSAFSTDALYSVFALKRWLFLWEQRLAARPAAVAEGVVGRQESAKHAQTRQALRPLLSLLRRGAAEPAIARGVNKVLRLMSEREYVRAHEEYITLSIGNAAWPMGVSAVGIHARAGRDRLAGGNQVAHVLNDETKRKYIQALKRLLSFAQEERPTVPSKMFVL